MKCFDAVTNSVRFTDLYLKVLAFVLVEFSEVKRFANVGVLLRFLLRTFRTRHITARV